MPSTTPLLIIVSSPSGAGKTTLCRKLLAEFGDLRFSVSHTTRAARPGEVDGSDYHFIDEATFDKMVDDEMFIEWAHVHGNRYGTRRAAPPRAQHPPGREAAQRLNAASKRSHSEAAGAADTAWQTQPPFSGPVSPPSG
jgi:hypothetical protein